MAYSVLDVAAYIVEQCLKKGKPINALKLQKILYYVQIEFLVKKDGIPCFEEELLKGEYGAISDEVYREYRKYSTARIQEVPRKREFYFDSKSRLTERLISFQPITDFQDRVMIQRVLEQCLCCRTFELAKLNIKEIPLQSVKKGDILSKEALFQYYQEQPSKLKEKMKETLEWLK